MQYARLCRVLAEQGVTVVIATISLFKEVHAWNRENLPGYFEVYLKVPVTSFAAATQRASIAGSIRGS
jgi:adenylylsulfate kinase-like enzyme